MADLIEIPVDSLDDHPRNPRIAIRDDVVEAIAAGMNGSFERKYAVHARPVGDRYELTSGHHRKRAAIAAGIGTVWAWVEEMDDQQAFMQLVTSNAQGELDPLEIGIHAFEAVPVAKGGRGKKGGLSEYAKAVGKAKGTVSDLVRAGEVAVNCSNDRTVFLGRAAHLAAIHKLPRGCWETCASAVVDKELSVKDTSERVDNASEGTTDKRRIALFCEKTSVRELARIDQIKDQVAESLKYDDLREQWLEWFATADPVDVKLVQAKRIDLEDQEAERLADEEEGGESAHSYPSVIVADPPWKYEFSGTDSRQIENQYPSATVEEIIDMRPEVAPDSVLFLWATVAKLREALEVIDGWGYQYKTHAVWDKEKIGMGYWFRGQHELLLVATRGTFSPPESSARVSSVFREGRGKHSKKPACVYEWIEKAFPGAVKLEMFCREPRDGWIVQGNEVPK